MNMLDNIKLNLDFEKLSWYVCVTILATMFSIFTLVFRPEYLHYGLITFTYGVIAQIVDTAFHNIYKEKKSWWVLFTLEFGLILIWLYVASAK